MKKTVKILCVGIGGYASIYLKDLLLPSLREDVEIVGMVEIAPQSCPFYPTLQQLGVPLYADMEAFYAEHSADLAIITTPTHLHTRQILCALSHGSHVMCEKPLSGESRDALVLSQAAAAAGKFVMIGYQWSYSDAILAMKRDIMNGRYGKPLFLKTMVLWPRPVSYYTRGGGWGGKLRAPTGEIINDSVVSNATAHYLHNILYVTGATLDTAGEVTALDGDLLRINAIETYDTAAFRFSLEGGAQGLFIASHATQETQEPMFDYRFERGSLCYRDEQKDIIGRTADGEVIHYGNPFLDVNQKIRIAIDAALAEQPFVPVCGIATAAPQVRAVERLSALPVRTGNDACIDRTRRGDTTFLSLRGLGALLQTCYAQETLPRELPQFAALLSPEGSTPAKQDHTNAP